MRGLPITILTKKDFTNFPEVDETGTTLEENAILKAKETFRFCQTPSLADDSGLEAPVLGGAPGVSSARYAGPGCTFDDNNKKLLKALEGIPENDRQATFRCVVAICFGEDDVEVVQGKVGMIRFSSCPIMRKPSPKFPPRRRTRFPTGL
jgi:XTP/dITP diphosphohydrolase